MPCHKASAGIPQSRCGLFRLVLAAAALTGFSMQSHADLGLDREAYGVWDREGGHPVSQYPYARGQEYAAEWTAINPARNTFDWAALDRLLQLAYDQNQRFFVKIQPVSATTMPPWIFTAGVPQIVCPSYTYGYYLDPEFKIYFEEMVQALGKHLREDVPAHLANIVSFVRVDTGTTGDEKPYETTDVSSVPAQYQISAEEWRNYRLWAFSVYDQAFQHGTGPQIPLLFQDIEVPAYQAEQDWVMANVTSGFGAKYGGQVRGHHLSESRNVPDSFKALSVDTPFRFFSVNEMDQTWQKPYFQLNLKLGMYWCAVEQLNAGMTIWDWSGSVMEGAVANDIVSSANFFNTWAAELDPPTARGGFCIFHEGLASDDTTKFPIATYGSPASKSNTARYTAICAAYASQGAKMDDLNAATLGQVAQRREQIGFNDSGWGIWPGNYERFVTQMDPDSTSKGLWRVNGTLTTNSHPYDRFARRFDSASGRNTMVFDINDNLLPSVGQRVRLSVDYLDRGTGQFAMRYDAVGNSQKTAFTVTKTNTNTWQTASVVVTDWAFGNQGPNDSDLTLANLDSDDDIFHKLEVIKLANVQIGTVGMGTVSGRTDATIHSPVIGDEFAESQRLELSVAPAPGWEFTGWSGELTGANTRPFLFPSRDSRVTATFAQVSVSSSVDNFNSANWTGGSGWSGAWTTAGVATTPGTIAELNGGNGISQITRTLAAPLSAATLSFGFDLDRIGGSDLATVEVFNGGWQTVWTEIFRGTDVDGSIDILTSGNISLSGTITQVRFTLNGNGVGDTFLIDNVLITGTPNVPTSSAPLFSSDPIGKAAAPVDGLYSGNLSGNASDPNGNLMTFSKLAGGPAWLGIDANGTLSGTPMLSDLGLNRWTVQVSSSGGADTAILLIDVIVPGPNPPAGLSYSSPPVYTKGTAIAVLSPSSGGGGVMRYVATPKLPNGLRLNNTTGVISGTPVEVKAATAYTITATNADGSGTNSLNITVNDIAPSALTYTQSSAIYSKGQTITPNTPTNSGGTVVSYAVSPPLPAGLLLNATTGVISGTPSVAGSTATTHTVTATNTGGSTATTLSILVEEVIINSTSITINDNAAASLYPSAIVVSPTDGTITKVTAAIHGLTHARQNDLDILLVGPSGQKVLLMSDVGGSASAVGVNLTFDDTAATSLTTDASSIPTGTYKPSNSGTTPDPFSAPAPAAPYDLTLSVFNGTNPTGTWSLYVMDDRSNNTGSISGGWRLSLEITAPPAAPASLSYSSNPATYTKDTAIPDNTPTSSGGAVVSYAVSPALPDGLTLNTSTGFISGTPLAESVAAIHTVTATNTGGSTTGDLGITVVSAYSAWSTQYQLTQGPEGDDDGDGNSNYFEFVAGLVPNNAASVFKTTAAPVSGQATQMAIVFSPIISGRTYKVKSSDSLASGTWIELVNPIVSDAGDVRTVIDSSATGDRKFYVIEITTP